MTDAESQPGPFLSDLNARSRRHAIFEDDGDTAYLYLTGPDSLAPVAYVWVYNRARASAESPAAHARGHCSSAPFAWATSRDFSINPAHRQWSLSWSEDGESVSLLENARPVACIVQAGRGRYSRRLVQSGPRGSPWSDADYAEAFEVI
jgi:hypothetical protein